MKAQSLHAALFTFMALALLLVAGWPATSYGAFSDVTSQAGLSSSTQSRGAAWGDYDGDRCLDLYVGAGGSNLLFRNNGNGTFSNVASAAGVADSRGTAGVSWADFNRDGYLDLLVINHLFPFYKQLLGLVYDGWLVL